MATRKYKIGDILLSGTAGKDLLINGEYWANEVGGIGLRITGGYGNDTITNSGAKAMLYGDDGDDSIYNGYHYYEPWNIFYDAVAPSEKKGNIGENSKVYGGSGNDAIKNRGKNTMIDAGEGNDSIENYGNIATIQGGRGNDTIKNSGAKSVLDGGSGNDIIVNGQYFERGGLDVSIKGGAGNDTITNAGANAVLDGGAGNDVIYNGYYYHEGIYYDNNSNNDQENSKYNGSNTTIRGGAGNDTISNRGNKVTIDAGVGNDNIRNWGNNVNIYTDSGRDTIENYGKNVTVHGGKGNETIVASGDKGVVFAGSAGNDMLYGTNEVDVFQFANGTGRDTIGSYRSGDVVQITKGSLSGYSFNGADLVLYAGNAGMVVKNGKNRVITVMDAKGKKSTKLYSNGKSAQKVIKDFMKALVGTNQQGVRALDQAVRISSSFDSFQSLTSSFVRDCRKAGSAERFLTDYCGIELGNKDTGAISGWDAGGTVEKTKSSVVADSGKMKVFKGSSFTVRGVTFLVPKNLTNDEQLVVNGLYTWWAEAALKLIEESYALSFRDSAGKIQLNFFYDPSAFAWATAGYSYDSSGRGSNLTLNINMSYTGTVNILDPNGSCNGCGGYVDRMIAHELTHSIMEAKMRCFSSLPAFIVEGSADLTAGGDDERTGDIRVLADNPSLLAQYVNPYYHFQDDVKVYAAGYMLFRYLAKQASNSYIPNGLSYNASKTNLTVTNAFSGKLTPQVYEDTVKIINAAKTTNSITIYGNEKNNTIYASKGGSNLYGQGGNDILIGGTGKDVFWYGTGDGNDIVKNYTPGKDSIRIFKGSLTSGSVSGGDVVLKIGSGSLKLIGMAGKKISVAGTDGKTLQHVFGTKDKNTTWSYTKGYGYHGANKTDTLKVAGKNAVAINLGNTVMYSNIDKIDAGNAMGKMTLTGGANYVTLKGGTAADVLKAGKAGATLEGGKGNDMLYGGAGKDKFIFRKGYGKDTVMSSGKGDIAYLYNITNIKQAKFSLSKGVLSMKFTNSSDTLTVKGWSASGMNTVVLGNGGKYQLGISSGKVTTKKI